uniref:Uncharacterized protein n=1 Tax=Amphimedon queenslandica TaxID=400682 RepID=A0A1X7VSV5_AMPQE
MNKTIVLERTVCKGSGTLGSFGFSVMGGASAKLPAVVCSVEAGGPAAESNQVFYTLCSTLCYLYIRTIKHRY